MFGIGRKSEGVVIEWSYVHERARIIDGKSQRELQVDTRLALHRNGPYATTVVFCDDTMVDLYQPTLYWWSDSEALAGHQRTIEQLIESWKGEAGGTG